MLALVLELKRKGRTVIFSTHIMTEAERICDEIAIIEKGSILRQGTLAALGVGNGSGSLEDVFIEAVKGELDDR